MFLIPLLQNRNNNFIFRPNSFTGYFYGPVLSGILTGTSYIPFPPWAVFFCYVPLWLFVLNQKKLKPILLGGFLCQFVVTVIGFNWVAYTLGEMGFSWIYVCLFFLIFIGFANLHIPLSLFCWFISHKILEKKKHSLNGSLCMYLLLPVYFALCTEYYPMIFEWHLGYTWFYAKWPAAQTAEIWGFQFLNTLTLFSNLFSLVLAQWFFYLRRFQRGKASAKRKNRFFFFPLEVLLVWVLLFMGLNLYGEYLKYRWPEPDRNIQVLMVQPNIQNEMQDKESWNNFILSKILKETTKHLQQDTLSYQPALPVDFILWPEGAYPYSINQTQVEKGQDPVQEWVSVFGVPLVVSAKGSRMGKIKEYTNSVFVFDEKGQLVEAPYDKTVLVPLGEYTPLGKWFPFIDRLLFANQKGFKKGTGANEVIKLKEWNLGFQICYESLFDWLTRRVVRKGADILINVTNDAWFGNWQEPWQHFYMALSRAIEVRRPLIRGTNSGFSAVVSARGDIFGSMRLGKNFSRIEKVAFYSKGDKTLFVSYGYYINQLFLWLCFILVHCYLLKVFYKARPQRQSRP